MGLSRGSVEKRVWMFPWYVSLTYFVGPSPSGTCGASQLPMEEPDHVTRILEKMTQHGHSTLT